MLQLKEADLSAKAMLRGMKAHLECPHCRNLYNDPRSLTCTHTYCRSCLQAMAGALKIGPPEGGTLNCPECNYPTLIPGGDASRLQHNFFLQHMMDLMAFYSSHDLIPLVFCGMCRKNGVPSDKLPPAIARCSTCSHFLCKDCLTLHSYDDFLSLHTTLSIVNRGGSSYFSCLKPNDTDLRNCKRHNWRAFTNFCITCSRGICDHCAESEHANHTYATPSELRPLYTSYIGQLRLRMKALLTKVEGCAKHVRRLSTGIELMGATQVEEILRTNDMLVSTLDLRQSVVMAEARDCACAREKEREREKKREKEEEEGEEEREGRAREGEEEGGRGREEAESKETTTEPLACLLQEDGDTTG